MGLVLEKIDETRGQGICQETLEKFLKARKFLPLFFYSPYTLMAWLMKEEEVLYIATLRGESALILHKDQVDIRFLFQEPSVEMIEAVQVHFNPEYIALNQVMLPEGTPFVFEDGVMTATNSGTGISYLGSNELAIDVDAVAEVADIDLASDYRKYMRKHPQLVTVKYEEKYFHAVNDFLSAWSVSRTEEQNKFADIDIDKRFIGLFAHQKTVHGILVMDSDIVVAISFFAEAIDGQALAIIQKNLRGYKQLGVYTATQRAKAMQEIGYKKMYIGPINSEFKKRFLPVGAKVQTYARVIMQKPGFDVGIRYLLRVF